MFRENIKNCPADAVEEFTFEAILLVLSFALVITALIFEGNPQVYKGEI